MKNDFFELTKTEKQRNVIDLVCSIMEFSQVRI